MTYPLGTIHAFDFDGTLTRRDTLIEFIRFALGDKAFFKCFARLSPILLLMKLGLYPNWRAKQRVFSRCFGGMTEERFNTLCHRFAEERAQLIRPLGMELIRQRLAAGDKVVVITASIINWVEPFFASTPGVMVLGTMVDVRESRLTGRFITKNCYGREKVNRLLQLYPERTLYRLVAYGDSRGDTPLLDFADEGHYRPFRKKQTADTH